MSDSHYEAGAMCVVYVATPDENVAKTLAHGMVENKLAACVNIVPKIVSVYKWRGKSEESNEAMLIIKTRSALVQQLSEFVRKNHPYEIAEVIAMKIEDGNKPYLDWLACNV